MKIEEMAFENMLLFFSVNLKARLFLIMERGPAVVLGTPGIRPLNQVFSGVPGALAPLRPCHVMKFLSRPCVCGFFVRKIYFIHAKKTHNQRLAGALPCQMK